MARYTTLFLAEAEDHLRHAEDVVRRLDKDPGCHEDLNALFRHLHSLKGMAATMGYSDMARISHALEDLLDRTRKDRDNGGVPEEDLHLVSDGLGYIRTIVRSVGSDRSLDNSDAVALSDLIRSRLREPRPTPRKQPEGGDPAPPVLMPVSEPKPAWEIELRLDDDSAGSTGKVVALVNQLGALGSVRHISPPLPSSGRAGFGKRITLILETDRDRDDLTETLEEMEAVRGFRLTPGLSGKKPDRAANRSARYVRVRADLLDILMENALELTLAHEDLPRKLDSGRNPGLIRQLQHCRHLVDNQYATLTELRLVPFETVANRVRAGVDALCRRQGKKVRFCMEGLMVRLDRSLLESLVDPLLHIMRNAIDHGIETAPEREAAGKPSEGTISLRLSREGNAVRISIEDDGRGMRAAELRNRAVALKLMSREQADRLSDRECHFLVTIPGFSTRDEAGNVSGRGVGMDVVRSEVESRGGRLEISSRPGAGTVFALDVPQSMAIIQALLVRSRQELFAVPVAAISRTLDLKGASVIRHGGRLFLEKGAGEKPMPAVTMNRYCSDDVYADGVALLPSEERDEVILVDEVIGRRDVLVRPLDPPLRMMKRFSGAAMLGDGSIALVIDPRNLTTAEPEPGAGL